MLNAVVGLTLTLAAASPKVFYVRDFGAIADGRTDCRDAVLAAIAAATASGGPAHVVFGEGVYRLTASGRQGYCLPISQASNVTIRGAGRRTLLSIASPDAGAFLVTQGRNVTLRDFTVDYDPVPFTQGLIRQVNVAEGWFDLEIADGYTTPDAANFLNAAEPYGKWGMIIDPEVRRIRAGTPDHYMTPRWERREGRVWRFYTAEEHYRLGLRHMRIGDRYVHLARGYGGVFLAQGCDGIAIENVTVHSSPGLAVGLVGNKGVIRVRKMEVRFAPGTDRLLTTNADGVHCQQNRSGPIIEGCYFEGMADDAINIYAPPNTLLEKRAETEWLVSPNCMILPGDRLIVLDPKTGVVRGTVRAAAVAPEGRAFRLTLDSGVAGAVAGPDHRSADTLYNLDACGAGFRILRNTMNGNRRYGCLIRAGDGLIEGNVFTDTTGAGVTLINEPDWPEGPIPWSVTVRNNRFVRGGACLGYADGGHGALYARAARLGHGLADEPALRNITIEGNSFEDCLGPAVYVSAAVGLTLRNNRFVGLDAPLARTSPVMIVERSRNVRVERNKVQDRRQGVIAGLVIMPDVPAGEDGVVIRGNRMELPEGVPALMDRRPTGTEQTSRPER
ncbi:MAG: hypothetical protein GX446_03520 [Chthonomonadales bacterium]|nr:hypothetical protein [Chthonomonadales bacterium]